MIIETKENLSSKNFYHGSGCSQKEMKIHPPSPEHAFYITDSIEYANNYADTSGGNVYLIKLADNVNCFYPRNQSDISKVEKDLPKLIQMVWFEKPIYGSNVKYFKTKDLESVCASLVPRFGAGSYSNYDARFNFSYSNSIIQTKSNDIKNKFKKDIQELDNWLETNASNAKNKSINVIQRITTMRIAILKVLKKHDYQAYVGVEDDGKIHNIWCIIDISALAEISANPIHS